MPLRHGWPSHVLHAASLVNLMEHGLGTAFDRSSDARFIGYAGGSNVSASQINGRLRRADVPISVTLEVDNALMGSVNDN